MAPGNNVTVVGNATRDPELRFTPSGQAVASFGLAVNRRWQNKATNDWEEAVSFFDVTCWAQMAENVAESIQKGTRVLVTGRLDQRSWETEQGDKRSKVEIVADEIAEPALGHRAGHQERASRRRRLRRGWRQRWWQQQQQREWCWCGGGARPVPNDPPVGYDDEEPFWSHGQET